MLSIAYASTVNGDLSRDDLVALLTSARAVNKRMQITGALLLRNGRFIQVIEGPDAAVRSLFAKIAVDPRHRDITVVTDEHIVIRQFPEWKMAYQSMAAISGTELPGPENHFGAYPPDPSLPEDIRRSQSSFDWLYDYWLLPVETPLSPAKAFAQANAAVAADAAADAADAAVAAACLAVAVAAAVAARDPARPKRERSVRASSGGQQTDAAQPGSGSSLVVAGIFDKIMNDVDSGALLPGDLLRDSSIAELLGTSRTPVREALQRLRTIGVVEAVANKFTRVAVVSEEKAANSIIVLAALYSAVLDEVIGHVPDHVIETMKGDRIAFLNSVALDSPMCITSAAASFYLRLVAESKNPALQQSIESVIHVVKLAGENIDQLVGIQRISDFQEMVLAAAIAGDLAAAKRGLALLSKEPRPGAAAASPLALS